MLKKVLFYVVTSPLVLLFVWIASWGVVFFMAVSAIVLPVMMLITVPSRWKTALVSALVFPVFLAGILGPCRGIVVLLHRFGLPFDLLRHIKGLPIQTIDFVVGACTLTLGLIGGGIAAFSAWRVVRAIRDLPTTPAAKARPGLSEFEGVIRPAEARGSSAPRIESFGREEHLLRDPEGDPILFHAERRNEPLKVSSDDDIDDTLSLSTRSRFSPFYVEDESGRIRVEPDGARFWNGFSSNFWERKCVIALTRDGAIRSGDRVYVLGHVSEDPSAPPSGRMVVRPTGLPREGGIADRLFAKIIRVVKGEEIFFVSDTTEEGARRLGQRAFRQVLAYVVAYSTIALGLLWAAKTMPGRIVSPWQ